MTKREKSIASLRKMLTNPAEMTSKSVGPAQFKRLGLSAATVRSVVEELRNEGYAIYANKNDNGSISYRRGRPSRDMIATAYASAPSLFDPR